MRIAYSKENITIKYFGKPFIIPKGKKLGKIIETKHITYSYLVEYEFGWGIENNSTWFQIETLLDKTKNYYVFNKEQIYIKNLVLDIE